jgi:large subunit ribosomal protein L29
MKIQAMLDWSPDEKAAKAKEWAQSLFTLRLQKATGQLENPMKIKQLKKDIARLKTAQNMSAAAAAAAAAHQVASHEATAEETESSEEHVSSKVKEAGAAPKPKGKVGAPGKGAKKRAAAAAKGAKKVAGAAAKAHSPSKKSSEPSGSRPAGTKAKAAPATSPKSKKK